MNAKQKKTLIAALLLVAVLIAALIAVRTAASRKAAAAAAAADSSAEQVTDADAEYSALTYNNGTATLSFALDDDGTWYWTDDPDFPLDNDYLVKLINTISGLAPVQTITDGDTLDAYGLDEPSMTLTATAADGTQTTFALGNLVAGDSGNYYLLLNGDAGAVYVVTDALHAELSNGIYDMMLPPELPVLTEERISSISVTGAVSTELTASVSKAGAADSSADSSADAGGVSVTWSSGGADVTDRDALTALVSAVSAAAIDRCEDYKPSDAAVSLCGLDAPRAAVTVNYTDDNGKDASFTLSIGNTTAAGGGYYVRLAGDTTVYSMTSDALSPILAVASGGLGE